MGEENMTGKFKSKYKKFLVLFITLALLAVASPVSASSEEEIEEEQFEVCVLRPTGDIITEWIPGSGTGYSEVDEEKADDTTTYIGTSTDGAKDVYEINPSDFGKIEKITVYGRFITDFPSSSFKLLLYNENSEEISFSEPIELRKRGSWETASHTWELNPFTEQKWLDEDLESIGIGICADYCHYGAAVFCTQVYIEIIYQSIATIDDLIDSLEEMNLNWRIEWRLKIKLRIAEFLIDRDIDNAAIRILENFIHQVERLNERRIEPEDAAILISKAEQVIENI
jgi:hypothetical protein